MPRKTVTIGDRTLALDARFDRLDLRDLPYRARLGNLPTQYPSDELAARWLPAYAAAKLVRNQGPDGACTGFGLAAVINYLLFTKANLEGTTTRQVSPAMLYGLARLYDEWPGEDYDGSSCRGALKGWHRHGVCREALWPYLLAARSAWRSRRPRTRRTATIRRATGTSTRSHCTLGVYYRIDARSVVDMQSAIFEVGAIYVLGRRARGLGRADAQDAARPRGPACASSTCPSRATAAATPSRSSATTTSASWSRTPGAPSGPAQGFALLPYEDWVTHGEDAWVFTLGVPRRLSAQGKRAGNDRPLRTPRFLVPSASGDARGRRAPRGPAARRRRAFRAASATSPRTCNRSTPTPRTATRSCSTAALRWATTSRPKRRARRSTVRSYLRPSAWLKKHRRRKLMIYAHGGLNSEGASITRIRALAPYALANGIYPLFITWRSGALETVGDLVEELFTKAGAVSAPARASGWIERLSDKTDRLLEPLLRGPGSALWGQMKLNAERAGRLGEGGAFMMVKRLEALAQEIDNLEVHLIGHSAGAILLGALLEPLRRARLHVKTLRLFAPACTTRFALERYRPALRSGQIEARHFYVHTLSDKLERDDSVGPYRKSLLYLVSRAFEDVHKTPLLGLDRSFDAETAADGAEDDLWSDDRSEDVKQWADFWDKSGGADNRIVLSRATVSTGGGSIDATHGCFDNAVDIMGDALGTIVNPRSPERVKIHRLDY